jgi:hypothetical protein
MSETGGVAAADKKVVLLLLDVYKLTGKAKIYRRLKLIILTPRGTE